jgi:hypothetical protein
LGKGGGVWAHTMSVMSPLFIESLHLNIFTTIYYSKNALFTDINNLAKYFRIFELLYTNHDVIFGGFLGFLCQFLGFAQDIFFILSI